VRSITGGAASNANLSSATLNMYCSTTDGADDGVIDYTTLRIAKAPIGGPAWVDVGGTATANGIGNIVSAGFTTLGRFALANNLGGPNPLLIELLSFEAKPNNGNIDIVWSTSAEINNDFFTIERSQDGINFEFVAKVPGAGNSNTLIKYFTRDKKPFSGLSFYRLKQTDFDGQFKYSKIIAVNCKDKILKGVRIYPNPVTSELTIEIPGNMETVNFEILSSTGAVVYKGNLKQKKTVQTSNFTSGIYLIKVSNEYTSEFKRVIKK
jgi:hypothetical protein